MGQPPATGDRRRWRIGHSHTQDAPAPPQPIEATAPVHRRHAAAAARDNWGISGDRWRDGGPMPSLRTAQPMD
jgi:hypothetical protein